MKKGEMKMKNSTLQKRLTGLLVNALAASGKCSEDDLIPTAEFITGFIKNDVIILPENILSDELRKTIESDCYWKCVNGNRKSNDKKTVRCAECEYLMFSDCYGECSKGYRGIVNPDDTCQYGKLKKRT